MAVLDRITPGAPFSTLKPFTIQGAQVLAGAGVPTLNAPQGSLYLNTTGSSVSTRLFVNTNGTNGWTAVTTAS